MLLLVLVLVLLLLDYYHDYWSPRAAPGREAAAMRQSGCGPSVPRTR